MLSFGPRRTVLGARVVGVLAATIGLLGLSAVALTGSASAALPSNCSQSGITVTCSYSFTGSAQTFAVPSGIGQITATVIGASASSFGGNGVGVAATLPVTPGETLNIYVGGGVTDTFPLGGAGGFNGGGSGCNPGCGGGGASDIREGGTALSNRIIVAGGGGGASLDGNEGGSAGFTSGSAGQDAFGFPGSGGGGGTQTATSNGGTISVPEGDLGTDGSAGVLGVGGTGAPEDGGGGGGGYYGGGGGAGDLLESEGVVAAAAHRSSRAPQPASRARENPGATRATTAASRSNTRSAPRTWGT